MTETNPADTAPAPPTPAAMPPRQPATEPEPVAEHAEARPLDESGWDPAAVTEIRKLRRENQRVRDRLRAAETDAERAITQLGALRHNEIERLAAEHLVDPADIWRAGADFTDDETGDLDPGKVGDAAQALISDKPHLARPQSAPPPSDRPVEGLRSGAMPTAEPTPKPSWQSVIRPRVGRIGVAE